MTIRAEKWHSSYLVEIGTGLLQGIRFKDLSDEKGRAKRLSILKRQSSWQLAFSNGKDSVVGKVIFE